MGMQGETQDSILEVEWLSTTGGNTLWYAIGKLWHY